MFPQPLTIINTKNLSSKCINIPTSNLIVPEDLKLQWTSALRRYDTKNLGKLGMKELTLAFKTAGSSAPAWRAFRAMQRADKNRDGFIEESEFPLVLKYATEEGYII